MPNEKDDKKPISNNSPDIQDDPSEDQELKTPAPLTDFELLDDLTGLIRHSTVVLHRDFDSINRTNEITENNLQKLNNAIQKLDEKIQEFRVIRDKTSVSGNDNAKLSKNLNSERLKTFEDSLYSFKVRAEELQNRQERQKILKELRTDIDKKLKNLSGFLDQHESAVTAENVTQKWLDLMEGTHMQMNLYENVLLKSLSSMDSKKANEQVFVQRQIFESQLANLQGRFKKLNDMKKPEQETASQQTPAPVEKKSFLGGLFQKAPEKPVEKPGLNNDKPGNRNNTGPK